MDLQNEHQLTSLSPPLSSDKVLRVKKALSEGKPIPKTLDFSVSSDYSKDHDKINPVVDQRNPGGDTSNVDVSLQQDLHTIVEWSKKQVKFASDVKFDNSDNEKRVEKKQKDPSADTYLRPHGVYESVLHKNYKYLVKQRRDEQNREKIAREIGRAHV